MLLDQHGDFFLFYIMLVNITLVYIMLVFIFLVYITLALLQFMLARIQFAWFRKIHPQNSRK